MREEVVENIPEMTPWGEVHKELENEKMTPVSKVDELIFQLNKELKANIVKQKGKNSLKCSWKTMCPSF